MIDLGCCWDVSEDSNHYCYKSAFQTLQINGTMEAPQARMSSFGRHPYPKRSVLTLPKSVYETNTLQSFDFNLKMASKNGELIDESIQSASSVEKPMATKIQLWINFIAQLTHKIERACESKVKERVSFFIRSNLSDFMHVFLKPCQLTVHKYFFEIHFDLLIEQFKLPPLRTVKHSVFS